jgi:hypothetical protein
MRAAVEDEDAGLSESCNKILYFFPPSLPLRKQLTHVRFCEGIVGKKPCS